MKTYRFSFFFYVYLYLYKIIILMKNKKNNIIHLFCSPDKFRELVGFL